MDGGTTNFQNMKSINVGNVDFKDTFSKTNFCSSWPTGSDKAIYANSYTVASSWQQGGISTWNADLNDTFCSSYYTLSSAPNVHHYFDEANTPINSFCAPNGSGYTDNLIEINGSSVNINSICSLNFGVSYENVSSVGNYWMYGNNGSFSNLTSINFSGLSSLSSVGDHWMVGNANGFQNLTSISFSGLSSLSSVGNYWMYAGDNGFQNLTSITFSGLSSLSSVGNYWMSGETLPTDPIPSFPKLTSINFSGLSSLSSVGNNWMNGNNGSFSSLTSISFSSLSSLSSVGENWMRSDSIGFGKVTNIYVSNVNFKSGFNTTNFCTNWPSSSGHNIRASSYVIASSWQQGGISTWNADLNDICCSFYTLSSAPSVHHYFDEANTPIDNFCAPELSGYLDNKIEINGSSVDINSICSLNFGISYGKVNVVGNNWMDGNYYGFSKLSSINFSGLSSLTSVGGCWMYGTNNGFSSLTSINFSGLSSLSTVGNNWMTGTSGGFSSLSSINFNGLSSLYSVGESWMASNDNSFSNLSSINFSSLISLTIVGKDWMESADGNSFQNMKSIYVGNVEFKAAFSTTDFCNNWPTSNGVIYGTSIAIALSWQQGGISTWGTSTM